MAMPKSNQKSKITDYHAKYFAHLLTRQGGKGIERLSQSLFDASVDLNPHQIDAASFALANPVSEGVLLADEVGFGKTIEAGLSSQIIDFVLYYIRKYEEVGIGKRVSDIHRQVFPYIERIAVSLDQNEKGWDIIDWIEGRIQK